MVSRSYSGLSRPPFIHPAIVMQSGSLARIELIARGSKSLQHMLGLARKYSDIGDRDRCMILRSNALLTITGLLELYRPVLEEAAISTTEELLESGQKCKELLVLLANTSRQALEEDGQRIGNFIMVSPSRCSPKYFINCDFSTTATRIWLSLTLKQLFALSQLEVSRPPSYHFPRRVLESSTKASWNGS